MMQEWINSHMDEQIEDLKGLLRIPSISRGTPEPGKPLGKDVYSALEYIVSLAHRLGFEETRILDGYCAYVDYGEGDELLTVITHLDVVPAGDGWDSDPFEPVIKDGCIFARGVVDDKSPAVSSLYALAALKNSGFCPNRKIRLLFGGDEERESACMERYMETEQLPDIAFTPDGSYPVVYSEMNILHAIYRMPLSGSSVEINCGEAGNVIPGIARASLSVSPVPVKVPRGYTAEFGNHEILIRGTGGHAAMNDLAKNALQCLLFVLSSQPIPKEDRELASGLSALWDYDLHGEHLGLDVQDESGHLTISPTMLKWDSEGVSLTLDCRYPFSLTEQDLLNTLDTEFRKYGFTRIETNNSPGLFIPRDSELVSKLLQVYEKHTGIKAEPVTMGGGTYARHYKNTVAFGIEDKDAPSQCHVPNEHLTIERIRFNTSVFADALALLSVKPE